MHPVEPRRSPLDAAHRALGARMVAFGGWEMPLAYPGGTLAEHMACRTAAVAFDVSHLGTVRVEGPGAGALLNATLTNDLAKIGPGRAQYTHLLDQDGSVLDDIIVWWRGADRFDVMPNASNTDRVRAAVGGEDVTGSRAVIAVQGPAARERLRPVAPEAAAVAHFGVASFEWRGAPCVAAGTGYTGEDGVEVAVPVGAADAFWDAVTGAGIPPAGLGARDTLRLEARRRLLGLVVAGRQPPREDYTVSTGVSEPGVVTSGNFSPVLGRGVALAFLAPDVEPGQNVEIHGRGRALAATVVKPPFVRGGRPAVAVSPAVLSSVPSSGPPTEGA